MHTDPSHLGPAEDLVEDPAEILAACVELAGTVAGLVTELGGLAEKSGAVAGNVVALLDPSDRHLAGFAAGLDSLSREVLPGLKALSRMVVSQAEQLAGRVTSGPVGHLPLARRSVEGEVVVAKLADLYRRARRARTWSVFDRSYHEGRAAVFDAFGDRLDEALRLLTYVEHERDLRASHEAGGDAVEGAPAPSDRVLVSRPARAQLADASRAVARSRSLDGRR